MKRILYAGGEFFTDDAVARALMDYASVLAIIDSADVVTVPGIDDRNKIREITLIMGPASQILSMGCDEPAAAMDTDAAIADLVGRAQAKLPNSVGVAGAGTSGPAESDAESTTHDNE
jgi:hypothetical protein